MKDPKILYISCHEILEYDECKLLTKLGFNVRSLGAYADPHSQKRLRPPIPEMERSEENIRLAGIFDISPQGDNKLPEEAINWADVIIFMHKPEWIWKNIYDIHEKWPSKVVIYRSIGQSTSQVEIMLSQFKDLHKDKFKIIRYSLNEQVIPGFAGADHLVRFYKDPEEFKSWVDTNPTATPTILMSCQAASTRGTFCHMQELFDISQDVLYGEMRNKTPDRFILGSGNEDIRPMVNGAELPYEEMKKCYQKAAMFLYSGTLPACYTLSFLEAFFTGTPIISVNEALWRSPHENWVPSGLFEVPSMLDQIAVFPSWAEGRQRIIHLLDHPDVARQLSINNYKKAREIFPSETNGFGEKSIPDRWKEVFAEL